MSTKSYSSFVVVLEWDWDCRTNLLITEPAPGGEPLWSVSGHPCNLRLNTTPAETCENKRLPGTTQSVATRWVIRGSRLLRTCLGISGAEEKYSEIPSDALKRLPSKVLGGTTSIRGSKPFRERGRVRFSTYVISISRPWSIESATAWTTFMYSKPSLKPGWGKIPPGDRTAAMKSASTRRICSSSGEIGITDGPGSPNCA